MSSIEPKTFTAQTGEEFRVRTAEVVDAAALLSYVRGVAAETEFFVAGPSEFPAEEQERQWIQEHRDDPGKLVLLAEASGRIVGSLSFANGSYRRVVHRGNLGVSVCEHWRRRGVGTALLRSLLAWATENPIIEKVCLEVFATNEQAIRLYKKLGFIEQGTGPKEIKLGPGHYVDVLWMYRFVKASLTAEKRC